MTDDPGTPPPATAAPATADWLEDWVVIWQSELAAMVADPELQGAAQRLIDAWAAQAILLARAAGAAIDAGQAAGAAIDATRTAGAAIDAARPPGPVPPPGTPPAAAASDARDTAIAALLDRVAALERRLAVLDPGRGAA